MSGLSQVRPGIPQTASLIGISGYLPDKDESGKEKWPKGEEVVWKDGYRQLDTSK